MLVMYCNAMQCIAIERINTYNKPVYTNKRENIYIDIFTCLHISKYLCVYIYIYIHTFFYIKKPSEASFVFLGLCGMVLMSVFFFL